MSNLKKMSKVAKMSVSKKATDTVSPAAVSPAAVSPAKKYELLTAYLKGGKSITATLSTPVNEKTPLQKLEEIKNLRAELKNAEAEVQKRLQPANMAGKATASVFELVLDSSNDRPAEVFEAGRLLSSPLAFSLLKNGILDTVKIGAESQEIVRGNRTVAIVRLLAVIGLMPDVVRIEIAPEGARNLNVGFENFGLREKIRMISRLLPSLKDGSERDIKENLIKSGLGEDNISRGLTQSLAYAVRLLTSGFALAEVEMLDKTALRLMAGRIKELKNFNPAEVLAEVKEEISKTAEKKAGIDGNSLIILPMRLALIREEYKNLITYLTGGSDKVDKIYLK